MDMQDNEFDGLFRNKLNSFESEPSERVWTGIDTELDKKKIAILPWLSIAASIIVLVSAGILFIPKHAKLDHSGESVVKTKPASVTTKPEEQVAVIQTPDKAIATVKPEQRILTERHKKPIASAPSGVKPNKAATNSEPVKPVEQPLIAAVVPSKTDQVKPQAIVPDQAALMAVKRNIDSAMSLTKPALAVADKPEGKPETPAVKKHGIRNFGELVNLVVAKVDKRKDKAVQFTDDEDGDGATLTAVNIGPVKIGKDER